MFANSEVNNAAVRVGVFDGTCGGQERSATINIGVIAAS